MDDDESIERFVYRRKRRHRSNDKPSASVSAQKLEASRESLQDLPKLEEAAVHYKGVRKRLSSYCVGGRVVERRQPLKGSNRRRYTQIVKDVVGTSRRAFVDAAALCSGRGEDDVVPQLAYYLHSSLPW